VRILIAEDIAMARRALQETLEEWGYDVVAVDDGAAAWRILQQEDAPRLVILDWVMPEMDGIEVCRRLRSRESAHTRAYVILLTVMDDTDNVVAALEAGADDFVVKPFRPDELRARLAVGRRFVDLHEDLVDANRRFAAQARTDELTGVLNRRAAYQRLDVELARAVRDGGVPFGVGVIDVDRFKVINDTYGHGAGDAVLREVTRVAASVLRPYDAVGRVGGDEFIVVLPRVDEVEARSALDRLTAALAAAAVCEGGSSISVTVSAGGAVWARESIDELVARADSALYRAKGMGGEHVVMAPAESGRE